MSNFDEWYVVAAHTQTHFVKRNQVKSYTQKSVSSGRVYLTRLLSFVFECAQVLVQLRKAVGHSLRYVQVLPRGNADFKAQLEVLFCSLVQSVDFVCVG